MFETIASLENLCAAWEEFLRGKRSKFDVQIFGRDLADNLLVLRQDLLAKTYRHGGYERFTIADPKPRIIHKASVRDRLLHHAVHRVLSPAFDRTFIDDAFSCRLGKGTHAARARFNAFARKVSRNHTRTCWVLKLDIRKFFASIDHEVLLGQLYGRVNDPNALRLLEEIVGSFSSSAPGKGLPLGNLTSQLFANVYMDPFDQFVKHGLKAKWYVRYADDFVLLSEDRTWLEAQLPLIAAFLRDRLRLELHPDKIFLKTFSSGVDFLGWVHFPNHRVLRAATKRRMLRRLTEHPSDETLQSYLGLLGHGNTQRLQAEIKNLVWLAGGTGFPPTRE